MKLAHIFALFRRDGARCDWFHIDGLSIIRRSEREDEVKLRYQEERRAKEDKLIKERGVGGTSNVFKVVERR